MSETPNSWVRARLSEIAEVIAGNPAPQGDQYFEGGKYPFVRVQDLGRLGDKVFLTETKDLINDSALKKLKKFPRNTVLFTKSGASTLKNQRAILAKDSYVVSHIGAAIAHEGISSKWVYYSLKQTDFAELAHSSVMPSLPLSKIKNISVLLPPEPEQARIVEKIEELLSGVEQGVESLKTAREQLKVYRQAVLKQAFEGKLTAKWREENAEKLESSEEILERIQQEREEYYQADMVQWVDAVDAWSENGKKGKKPTKPSSPRTILALDSTEASNLPDLPLGWAWLRVGDLCDVVRGGSPRPAGDSRFYDGDIPFLKVADLTRKQGRYVDSATHSIKPAGLQKTRQVEPNTLLISNSGATLGVPKICLIKTTFNDGIAAFLGLDESVLSYHYYFWASKTLELRAINQGAAQPNLNTDLLKNTFIPVCSSEEMNVIADLIERSLSVCDYMNDEIEAELSKAERLRQSILKKAFSGSLVDQNPDDEPASKLLERIRQDKQSNNQD